MTKKYKDFEYDVVMDQSEGGNILNVTDIVLSDGTEIPFNCIKTDIDGFELMKKFIFTVNGKTYTFTSDKVPSMTYVAYYYLMSIKASTVRTSKDPEYVAKLADEKARMKLLKAKKTEELEPVEDEEE